MSPVDLAHPSSISLERVASVTLGHFTCFLNENVNDEDALIKNMVKLMIVKFDKYWDEYSVVLAFGAILDPRIKLETLGFCFEKIDSLTWELKLKRIKEKLYKLFAEYSTKDLTTYQLFKSISKENLHPHLCLNQVFFM